MKNWTDPSRERQGLGRNCQELKHLCDKNVTFSCAGLYLTVAILLSLYEGQLVLMQVLKMWNKFFQQYVEEKEKS